MIKEILQVQYVLQIYSNLQGAEVVPPSKEVVPPPKEVVTPPKEVVRR